MIGWLHFSEGLSCWFCAEYLVLYFVLWIYFCCWFVVGACFFLGGRLGAQFASGCLFTSFLAFA